MRYADIHDKPRSLLALTSLTPEEFVSLLPAFTAAFDAFMTDHTIVYGRRWDRRYTTYQNSPLPTMEDKLLFILSYLKTHPLQEVQGRLFGMSQSNANKWIHLLHAVLNAALADQDAVPARSAEELARYFAGRRAPKTDAAETEPALFFMTAPSDR
jgi:hypothetical protein